MRFLGISGSARRLSTNTHFLQAMRLAAPDGVVMNVFDQVGGLPVFSPDDESDRTPQSVRAFMDAIALHDGLIISSPEYVRSIPGGLKNAIDWLISGEQLIAKPIALVHASHRGDDMLATLRMVLSTASENFTEDLFLRVPLMKETAEAITAIVKSVDRRSAVETFLINFREFCETCADSR